MKYIVNLEIVCARVCVWQIKIELREEKEEEEEP